MTLATALRHRTSRVARLERLFAPTSDPVSISHYGQLPSDPTGITGHYWLSQKIDAAASIYAQHDLGLFAVAGGRSSYMIVASQAGIPMTFVDDNDPTNGITYTGAGWTAGNNNTAFQTTTATDGAITSGSGALAASLNFPTNVASAPARRVLVNGAGVAGAQLDSAISARTDGSHVTLGTPASTTVTGATTTLEGQYRQDVTAGDTASFTTPAACAAISLRIVVASNGGLAKVAVDGDLTKATSLSTAQDLVTAGTYPNTILVANGGTLNPTDRVFDCYAASANFDQSLILATALANTTHTVTVTVTGYKRAAASAARTYLSGYGYGVTITAAAGQLATVQALSSLLQISNNEYAWTYNGSAPNWVGNTHGYERTDSLTTSVDGTPVTMTNGQCLTGTTIVVTRNSTLFDPADNSTVIGTVVTTWTLAAGQPLVIRHTVSWAVNSSIGPGYPAMMSFDATNMNRACTSGYPGPVTLAGASTFKAVSKADAAWMWQSGGQYAALMQMPTNPAPVNNFTYATPTTYTSVEDRPDYVKTYYQRNSGGTPEPITPASVWSSEAHYYIARFPNGADAALAGV